MIFVRRFSNKRVLFLGSDQISEICLKSLVEKFPQHEFSLISTSETSPPAKLAKTMKMQTYIESKGKMQDWKILSPSSQLWNSPFDFIISASFGYLIPNALISFCKNSLNFHPSLLPKYRGSSPIQHALYNNDEYTGVSVISIDPLHFDKGLILKQERLPENIQNETYASLSVKLAKLGGDCLSDIVQNYEFYSKNAVRQDDSQASKALKISPELAKLSLTNTRELYNRFRSLYGTSLNPYFTFKGQRVLILAMSFCNSQELAYLTSHYPAAVPGSLWLIYPGISKTKSPKFFKSIDKTIYLKTADHWIAIKDFLQAGKSKENRFIDFVDTHIDVVSYQALKNFSTVTGSDLILE